jgi:hypothetical protein
MKEAKTHRFKWPFCYAIELFWRIVTKPQDGAQERIGESRSLTLILKDFFGSVCTFVYHFCEHFQAPAEGVSPQEGLELMLSGRTSAFSDQLQLSFQGSIRTLFFKLFGVSHPRGRVCEIARAFPPVGVGMEIIGTQSGRDHYLETLLSRDGIQFVGQFIRNRLGLS